MPPADVAQPERIGPCGGVSLVLFVVVRGVILQFYMYDITTHRSTFHSPKIIFNIQQDFVVIYLYMYITCILSRHQFLQVCMYIFDRTKYNYRYKNKNEKNTGTCTL